MTTSTHPTAEDDEVDYLLTTLDNRVRYRTGDWSRGQYLPPSPEVETDAEVAAHLLDIGTFQYDRYLSADYLDRFGTSTVSGEQIHRVLIDLLSTRRLLVAPCGECYRRPGLTGCVCPPSTWEVTP